MSGLRVQGLGATDFRYLSLVVIGELLRFFEVLGLRVLATWVQRGSEISFGPFAPKRGGLVVGSGCLRLGLLQQHWTPLRFRFDAFAASVRVRLLSHRGLVAVDLWPCSKDEGTFPVVQTCPGLRLSLYRGDTQDLPASCLCACWGTAATTLP